MKNILIIILAIAVAGIGYSYMNYKKAYTYSCISKANIVGIEGWECHSAIAGQPDIQGVSVKQ